MSSLLTQVSKTVLCTGHHNLLSLELLERKTLKQISGLQGASGAFDATAFENDRTGFSG